MKHSSLTRSIIAFVLASTLTSLPLTPLFALEAPAAAVVAEETPVITDTPIVEPAVDAEIAPSIEPDPEEEPDLEELSPQEELPQNTVEEQDVHVPVPVIETVEEAAPVEGIPIETPPEEETYEVLPPPLEEPSVSSTPPLLELALPSSTTPLIEETPTSTPSILESTPIPETPSSTSTVQNFDPPPIAEAPMHPPPQSLASDVAPPPAQDTTPPIPEDPPPLICLAMIAPYPEEGREWVALYGLTPSSSHRILQWSIADAQSSLVRITEETPLLWDEASQTLRYEVKSSRLNNDGDSVILTQADGSLHEQVTYTKTKKGAVWRRTDCMSAWHIVTEEPPMKELDPSEAVPEPPTMLVEWVDLPPLFALTSPTPGATTPTTPKEPTPPPSRAESIQPLASATTHSLSTQPPANTPQTPSSTTALRSTATKTTLATNTQTPPKAPPKKSTTTKTPTTRKVTTAKKPTTKTTTPATIPLLSMSTLLDEHETRNGTRVRLTGLVANAPKLVGAQKFVLLNPDGKGLLVQGSSKQPSPTRGTVIELTGTLSWNDSGIMLKQGTQDTWTAIGMQEESAFPIRPLPLPAPALEDGWSHTELEGTLQEVKASSAMLETADADIVLISLPSALGYRAGRLKAGDRLHVVGLYDPRQSVPVIIPQHADHVRILVRAPIPAAQTSLATPANAQPWLPLGLVGGTLLATEGWRRSHALRSRLYERARLLATQQTPGSSSS